MAERRSAQRLVGDSSVHLFKQHMDLIAHYNALVQSTDNGKLRGGGVQRSMFAEAHVCVSQT